MNLQEPPPHPSCPHTFWLHLHLGAPSPPWYQDLGSLSSRGPSKAPRRPYWALFCATQLSHPQPVSPVSLSALSKLPSFL